MFVEVNGYSNEPVLINLDNVIYITDMTDYENTYNNIVISPGERLVGFHFNSGEDNYVIAHITTDKENGVEEIAKEMAKTMLERGDWLLNEMA